MVNSVLPILVQTNGDSVKGLLNSKNTGESTENSFIDVLLAQTNNSAEATTQPLIIADDNKELRVEQFLSKQLLNGSGLTELSEVKVELLNHFFQQEDLSLQELMQSIKSVLTTLFDYISEDYEGIEGQISELLQKLELVDFEKEVDSQDIFMSFVSILSQVDFTKLFLQQEEPTQQNKNVNFQQFFKTIQSLVEKFSSENELMNKLTQDERIAFDKVLQQLQKFLADEAVLKQAYANIGKPNETNHQSIYRYPNVYVPIKNVNENVEQKTPLTSMRTTLVEELAINQNNKSLAVNNSSQSSGGGISDERLPQFLAMEGNEQEASMQKNDNVTSAIANSTSQIQTAQKFESLSLLDGQNKPVSYDRFVQQFTSILHRGKMMNNGQLQKLTIQLKPEHLGTLKIELVQENNEMVARIISASKAAKELIESQIQGLRHAFIQQNITVSRIDIETQMYQENQQDFNEQSNRDSQNDQEHHHKEDQDRQKFSDALEETLVNYEV